MKRLLVIDTNVVVAALFSRAGDSPPRRLLDGMLVGGFPFLLSSDLLAEYRRVLLRRKIRARHGLTAAEVDILLTAIAANAQVRDPDARHAPTAPDLGDDHLWRLLHAAPSATLVTGDRRLLEQPPPFASVVTPRTALDLLPS